MESVKKARARLQAYPKHLAACGPQATIYAKCVARYMGEVRKDQCQEEFNNFKKCVESAAKKAGTKL